MQKRTHWAPRGFFSQLVAGKACTDHQEQNPHLTPLPHRQQQISSIHPTHHPSHHPVDLSPNLPFHRRPSTFLPAPFSLSRLNIACVWHRCDRDAKRSFKRRRILNSTALSSFWPAYTLKSQTLNLAGRHRIVLVPTKITPASS